METRQVVLKRPLSRAKAIACSAGGGAVAVLPVRCGAVRSGVKRSCGTGTGTGTGAGSGITTLCIGEVTVDLGARTSSAV